MSIATIVSSITRKLHEVAVSTHITALRGEVKAANELARAADASATIATALAGKAIAIEYEAHRAANNAAIFAGNVKADAQAEAVNIGGTL